MHILGHNPKAWLARIGLLSILILLGCMNSQNALSISTEKISQRHPEQLLKQHQNKSNTGQGRIEGKVTQLTGNHMPGISHQTAAQREQLFTTVWIFTGRIASPGSPYWPIAEAQQHPGLLRQVESNHEGYYSTTLSAGEYTVFAQFGEMLYLNAFQRDGSYQSVKVAPNKTTALDLVNTEEASF